MIHCRKCGWYCDTLYKMWQMNHRDCNKKSTVTASICKKKVDCKWKKLTVTISTCKSLQALIATVNQLSPFTVNFFCLQSTFFTGADSYSQFFLFTVDLFCYSGSSAIFVQCITILITYGGQLK